jgi:hypothetical protein
MTAEQAGCPGRHRPALTVWPIGFAFAQHMPYNDLLRSSSERAQYSSGLTYSKGGAKNPSRVKTGVRPKEGWLRPASGFRGEKEKRETYNGMQAVCPFFAKMRKSLVFSVASFTKEMACLEWQGGMDPPESSAAKKARDRGL